MVDPGAIYGMVGSSDPMLYVYSQIETLGPRNTTVLISGETGTGKGLVAQALHDTSPRSKNKFIKIDCPTIPKDLLESELYGHIKGSFTGAARRIGKFQEANNGTIFLDDIAELEDRQQAKFLGFLDDKVVVPLGSNVQYPVNVRIIAATNTNLEQRMLEGRFRKDLYFRLAKGMIYLPPVRERDAEDINRLIQHYYVKYMKSNFGIEKAHLDIDSDAMEFLASYAWPGNVREIDSFMEHFVNFSGDKPIRLEMTHLKHFFGSYAAIVTDPSALLYDTLYERVRSRKLGLPKLLDEIENALLNRALKESSDVQTKAAELLGVTFRQFRYKIKQHSE